jgi:nucleoside-diphosphate-sugar epimerase
VGVKIVVTGGSGALGQFVIRELLTAGHAPLSLDRSRPPEALCPTWQADLTRAGDVYQALVGAEGVIHLAAYQAPNLAPDTETFTNNVAATYNVLHAAAALGTPHVVLASSVAAYGFLYAPRMWAPDYLPLDEAHPCRPVDPYGLSKTTGEALADAFARRGTTSIVSLRLPGVNFDLTYERIRRRWAEPGARLGNFWSYIDARDAALACRLAVEVTLNSHAVLNVAAPTSTMREPTVDLIARYLPDVAEIRPGADPHWAGLDSSKAARVLGFRAVHTWQRYLTGAEG